MTVIVIGAGMAGLLAGSMLRSECESEAQPNLPNNHSAVLRFRSTAVADTLNIPFKEVQVMKAVKPWRNPVADAMSYSYKNTGTSTLRSITSANGEVSTRYISPPDLIERMADCVTAPIDFGMKVDADFMTNGKGACISTLPMPSLMKMLGWETKAGFHSVNGTNLKARVLGMDAYFSLYVPDPDSRASRISMTGDQLTVECPQPFDLDVDLNQPSFINEVAESIGVRTHRVKEVEVHHQKYAKILPADDSERKRFMLWATEKFNIYSLGRFATWRPGLLLDDVVKDVRIIHNMINGATAYEAKKGILNAYKSKRLSICP